MLDKIKNYPYHQLLRYFRDIRVVGLLIFGIIVLMISWSGVSVIETNYGLEKQVAKLKKENDVRQLENQNLKLKNEYYNTDQYLELQARKQFGRAAPGETVLLVPKSVAMAHSVDVPMPKSDESPGEQSENKSNFQAWLDFFLHRKYD